MNCSKCSAELKDGAKFCSVCGTPVQAQKPKNICPACGLELPPSSKFCSVCGTPVASAGTAPANSSDNLVAAMQAAAQESLRQEADTVTTVPVGANVSLEKSPAAATPFPAPASPVLAPTENNPAPTGFAPSQPPFSAPSDIFGSQGYSAPNAGMTPPPPANDGFAPSIAAAATTVPVKKKHTAAIIIGAAAALLVIAAAVIYFMFKGPVMNLFMGNNGYAAMIEGNSIGNSVQALGNPAVSESISAIAGSGVQLSALSADRTASAIDDSYNDRLFGQVGSVNFGTVISTARNYLSAGYGSSGVTFTGSANITLTDTAKELISSDSETIAEIEKVIEEINSTKVTYSLSASDTAAAMTVGMTDSSMTLNARGLILTDGTAYLMFPFNGGKALKITIEQDSASVTEVKPLSIDPEEISRLARELMDIYLEAYKSSAITIDNGELTAYGMTANGRLITAELDGAALEKLFTDMADHIANDSYLCNKITEFASANGLDFTLEDFRNSVRNYVDSVKFDANDSLVIKTVTDNSNNVLAKSYTAYDNANSVYFACVCGKDKTAVEMGENEKAVITADVTFTSENSGTVNITAANSKETYSFKIAFENASVAQFCGRDIIVGKYTLTFTPPADFTEDAGEYKQALTALCSSAVVMESSVDNGDFSVTFGLDVPQYGSVSINAGISPKGADNELAIPADFIDITSLAHTEGSLSDDDISKVKEICSLISDMRGTISASSSSPFAEQLCGQLGELADQLERAAEPTADYNDVTNLLSDISTKQSEVYNLPYRYPYVNDSGLLSRASELERALSDLYDKIYAELIDNGYELPLNSFTEYKTLQEELFANADELANDFIAADNDRRTNISFDGLTFDEMTDKLIELESRYYEITNNYYDELNSDDALYEIYTETADAYSEMLTCYFDVNDSYSDGNIQASKMRRLRTAAENFAKSLGELEAAVQNGQI